MNLPSFKRVLIGAAALLGLSSAKRIIREDKLKRLEQEIRTPAEVIEHATTPHRGQGSGGGRRRRRAAMQRQHAASGNAPTGERWNPASGRIHNGVYGWKHI